MSLRLYPGSSPPHRPAARLEELERSFVWAGESADRSLDSPPLPDVRIATALRFLCADLLAVPLDARESFFETCDTVKPEVKAKFEALSPEEQKAALLAASRQVRADASIPLQSARTQTLHLALNGPLPAKHSHAPYQTKQVSDPKRDRIKRLQTAFEQYCHTGQALDQAPPEV